MGLNDEQTELAGKMIDVSISTKEEILHILKKFAMVPGAYADPGDVVYRWEKKGSINGQLSYKL